MTHVEKPVSDYELDTECDLGPCLALFTIWDMDGEIQVQLESVRALSEETGCYEDVQRGEEFNRWKALLDTPKNRDFVLEKFYE